MDAGVWVFHACFRCGLYFSARQQAEEATLASSRMSQDLVAKEQEWKFPKRFSVILGVNLQNRGNCGMCIYHQGRLVKIFERMGLQDSMEPLDQVDQCSVARRQHSLSCLLFLMRFSSHRMLREVCLVLWISRPTL